MPREDAIQKGRRLYDEGHVGQEHEGVRCWPVRGDGGKTYVVTVGPSVAACTCPSTGICSHIYAACWTLTTPNEDTPCATA